MTDTLVWCPTCQEARPVEVEQAEVLRLDQAPGTGRMVDVERSCAGCGATVE